MSFQLTLQIDNDGSTNVDFDGEVNHMVLIGVLENIKHSVLRTVEMQALSAGAIPSQDEDNAEPTEDLGEGGGASAAQEVAGE